MNLGECVIRLSVEARGSACGTFSEPRASLSEPQGCSFVLCCMACAVITDLIKMKAEKCHTYETQGF